MLMGHCRILNLKLMQKILVNAFTRITTFLASLIELSEWVRCAFCLGKISICFFFFLLMVSILFMLADKHSRSKPLNIEEEQYMRVFYENKLQEVCNNFHFPHKIQVCVSLFP